MTFIVEQLCIWLFFLIMLCVNYLLFCFKYLHKYEFWAVLLGYVCGIAVILWGMSLQSPFVNISFVFTSLGIHIWVLLSLALYAIFVCFLCFKVMKVKNEHTYFYAFMGLLGILVVFNVAGEAFVGM
ncbi:hypothetical protein OQH61_07695 [Helicobacter sp. MIT 21-1697]|uniref:hypothetical protein n=1 Tax=Helicobacter sp. MIT 21-1697 TaxID=2993733 RepID=UPI00224B91E3|nr:hypothetical protein [Helicobacter sp. MIT 21-1697]MCX2717614.1 hypothetical protein [Helicobacter sp. MIT 21-1697]